MMNASKKLVMWSVFLVTANSGQVSRLRRDYQDELEAFTWSALVATGIAIQDNKIHSRMSEHIFIMNWLTVAKKRKIFSKLIINELDWLITQGTKKNVNAQLKFKIEYLYYTTTGDVTVQNSFFKFTYVIETLRNNGWESFLLSPGRWRKLSDSITASKGNFIFMDDAWLQVCFGPGGQILKSFCIRVSGDADFAKKLFRDNNLPVEFVKSTSNELHFFHFIPDDNVLLTADVD